MKQIVLASLSFLVCGFRLALRNTKGLEFGYLKGSKGNGSGMVWG